MKRSPKAQVQLLRKDEKGVVAIMFGLLFFLLIALISIGIDLSFVYNKKDKAQLIADEAVLYAINYYKNKVEEGNSKASSMKMAKAAAQQYIDGRQQLADGSITSSKIQMQFTDADQKGVKTWAHLEGNHESFMTQAIGFKNIPFKVAAEAKIAFGDGKYEFIFLVDVSPSMGIGASTSDRQIMQRAIGCQFACHEPWYSTVSRAKAAGAQLRIDVVKNSLKSLVTQLEDGTDVDLKTALYSFSNHLHIQTGLNEDISIFKRHAENISIHREFLRGGGTNIHGVFRDFSGVLQTLKPKSDVKQHIIIISDATNVLNVKSGRTTHIFNSTPGWRRYNNSFNPKWCDDFKKNEARTVHTMLVEPDNRHYLKDSTSSMKGCATGEEYFYRANSAAEIDKAFKDLFENILKSVYLSS
ncbi:vWA domain-containing protein [Roseibium sediminis]|uniref:vWA domain-containing protein n=1 Tax=Roseibium sediminis TaxID=1775174 RepID=UPI00123CE4C2|nr:vWA domain-containing protein [Roseibium sediminis]